MRKLLVPLGITAASLLYLAGPAAAQTQMTVEPDTVGAGGEHEITVTLTGFTAELPLFVLPCDFPADGDVANVDVTTCDQSNLTPVVMDADGAGTITVTYDVPAEGIAIIAGDAEQTESALALVSIGAVPTMTLDVQGVSQPGERAVEVSLTGFSPEIPLFVLPCAFPADGTPAGVDVTTCDQANLAPVVMDADGAGTVSVTYDVPAEGIAIIAGDAEQTESALALLPVVQTSMTVTPDAVGEAGSQDIEVSVSGFSAELPLFVLPCAFPAGGDLAALDTTTCDQANLTPVTTDADGAGSVTVSFDVPAEGIAVIAGDAAQSQSAVALVAVDPSLAEPEEPEEETDTEATEDAAEDDEDAAEDSEEDDADGGGSGGTIAIVVIVLAILGAIGAFLVRRRSSS